jgi:ketosteroid isomerase-like protein
MKQLPVVLLALAMACTGAWGQPTSMALSSLVETERAFAKTCEAKGVRASFLQFFADDGIAFFPEPTVYGKAVKGRPAPDPHAVRLQWEPQAGDVAASGDLGYTTGPFIRTDNTKEGHPQSYGQFFSVWKRNGNSPWRVAIDIGTSSPSAPGRFGSSFAGPARGTSADWKENRTDSVTLHQLDRVLGESCAASGLLDGYKTRIDPGVRFHRENESPLVGENEVCKYLATQCGRPSWILIGSGVSSSDDLGYTYGSYLNSIVDSAGASEKGYYVHVWRRDRLGRWKLVADIVNPEGR